MKLKFVEEDTYWLIWEVGTDTEKVHHECLGIIFKDELEIHCNITEDYSEIIDLEDMKQITDFMEDNKFTLKGKRHGGYSKKKHDAKIRGNK